MNWYGSGSTSNSPSPPRTAVFPLLKGSHAKPTRGSKFLVVGLLKKEPVPEHPPFAGTRPQTGNGSIKFRRLAILPLVSVGTVDISYRRPRLSVRFGRTCQSS